MGRENKPHGTKELEEGGRETAQETGDILENKVLFVLPIKPFLNWIPNWVGEDGRGGKRKDRASEWVVAVAPAAEHIDSSLNACDAPAPAQTEGNWLEMVEQA